MQTQTWKRGEFKTYYAKMKMHIGGKDDIQIAEGDELQYDGTILKYGGTEINTLQLRSAIMSGWITDDPNDNSRPNRIVPVRNRAIAQSINRDLGRVQRVQGHIDTDNMDEETVMNVSDRRQQSTGHKVLNVPLDSAKPKIMTAQDNRRTSGNMSIVNDVEDQEGVEIGRVRTPAQLTTDIYSKEAKEVKQRLEELEGSGFIPNKNVIEREGVSIKTTVGNQEEMINFSEGKVVGKVRHTASASTEGIQVLDTSNRSARSTPNIKIDAKIDPRVRIARAFDPDFPSDWSFSGKLSERLACVNEHGASPRFLEALYAAEGDQMRKVLQKEFPKQFKS
jgi:hypothetical protein